MLVVQISKQKKVAVDLVEDNGINAGGYVATVYEYANDGMRGNEIDQFTISVASIKNAPNPRAAAMKYANTYVKERIY